MVKVSAPGKMFVSGEWAVLELGNPGIVAAVNKRVYAEIEPAIGKYISLTITDFNIRDLRFTWTGEELKLFPYYRADQEKIKFLKLAVETTLKFLQEKKIEIKPFKIKTWGEESQLEVNGEMKKVGFGSSAATAVAVVKGLLDFHGYQATNDEIFKLATIVHYFAQGKVGSGFDVAASTYGGMFAYKRFDADWLVGKTQDGKTIGEIIAAEWPRFEIEKLRIPENFFLDIAWTKQSASTPDLVKRLNAWAKDNKRDYKMIYDSIANVVRELLQAWKAKDKTAILELLRRNEELLRELSQKSSVPIETDDLKLLSDIANECGGAGKLSGAGGGDCGIAVSFDRGISQKIRTEWIQAGLHVLDAAIDKEGVKRVL